MSTTPTGSKILLPTARDETATLIASDKVEGTAVYGADSQKIGRIENVMIEKVSGHVAYAVLSFGGWLGMAQVDEPANTVILLEVSSCDSCIVRSLPFIYEPAAIIELDSCGNRMTTCRWFMC